MKKSEHRINKLIDLFGFERITLVKNCKLVYEISETEGCDCWGNSYWDDQKYFTINGKKEKVFDGWYVIHDGKNVKEVISEWMLNYRKKNGTNT